MASLESEDITTRRVLRNTLSNYIGKFISLAAWFALTPFILRQVGDANYGLWVLVGSVVAYGTLLDFGIAGAITKYVAEYSATGDYQRAQRLVATALSIYSIIGLVIVIVSAIIAPVFPALFNISPEQHGKAIWLVFLSGIGVGISIPAATTMAVLRGLQRFDLMNLISAGGTLLQTAASVAVLFWGGGVIGLTVVAIVVRVLMQIPGVWYIQRIAPELHFGWRGAERKSVRTVASFSWAIFLLHVGGQLETKTDEIVIGAFLPVSAVTPYSIAQKLSTLPLMMTEQFLKLILPMASGLHAEKDHVRLRSLYVTSTRLTVAVFLPIGGILVILARPILSAWVGVAYADYAHLAVILVLASLIDTILWPAGFVLQGMARHRLPAIMAMSSGITNLILSIILVRSLGLTGVALGTLIPTTIVAFGFVLPYAMRIIQVSVYTAIRQAFMPAILPAVPMVIVTYLLRELLTLSSLFSIAIAAGIGLLVYLIGYLSVGASEVERQTCQDLAISTLRFAKECFGRS